MKAQQTEITLTVAEIIDVAQTAGLVFQPDRMPEGDELDAEYTVQNCPEKGLDDAGIARHYRYVAFDAEYPEEGSNGLGPEIMP